MGPFFVAAETKTKKKQPFFVVVKKVLQEEARRDQTSKQECKQECCRKIVSKSARVRGLCLVDPLTFGMTFGLLSANLPRSLSLLLGL